MEWMLMPLRRYAEFTGRSRRMEYWMYTLGVALLYLVMMTVVMVIGFSALGIASSSGTAGGAMGGMIGMIASFGIFAVVFLIVWLGLLVPSIAVAVRRLHDTDRSGWWLMIYVGPYLLSILINIMAVSSNSSGLSAIAGLVGLLNLIAGIVLLVFMCLPGTPGPNRYGPDPMGGASNLAETFR